MQDDEGTFQLGKLILQDIEGEDYSAPGVVIHEQFWELARPTRDKIIRSWLNAMNQIQDMSDEHVSFVDEYGLPESRTATTSAEIIMFPTE